MSDLKPEFKTNNVVTPFKWADCKLYKTRKVPHHGSLENVESDIKGIFVEINARTTCPSCRNDLNYVHYKWKTRCHYCGLWMAYTDLPGMFAKIPIGNLTIWRVAE